MLDYEMSFVSNHGNYVKVLMVELKNDTIIMKKVLFIDNDVGTYLKRGTFVIS